jgi:NAD(P)-dependent dehydrogenase (short-subunit alcohol dehydrogenase family)
VAEWVVIIGGGSGIGEATAAAFLRRGAKVLIAGRDWAKLEAAAKRLGDVAFEGVDARNVERLQALFERRGPFEHLVLTLSGGRGGGPFKSLSMDDLRSGLEGKLLAQLAAAQAALPYVTQSITFVSSASARAAMTGTAGLAAINGAVESVVRPLAVELAPIRVNAVSPGVIDTPWWDARPPEMKAAAFEHTAKTLPVGRVGKPEDVAAAIVAVATNGFITGTVVDVSGGAMLAR